MIGGVSGIAGELQIAEDSESERRMPVLSVSTFGNMFRLLIEARDRLRRSAGVVAPPAPLPVARPPAPVSLVAGAAASVVGAVPPAPAVGTEQSRKLVVNAATLASMESACECKGKCFEKLSLTALVQTRHVCHGAAADGKKPNKAVRNARVLALLAPYIARDARHASGFTVSFKDIASGAGASSITTTPVCRATFLLAYGVSRDAYDNASRLLREAHEQYPHSLALCLASAQECLDRHGGQLTPPAANEQRGRWRVVPKGASVRAWVLGRSLIACEAAPSARITARRVWPSGTSIRGLYKTMLDELPKHPLLSPLRQSSPSYSWCVLARRGPRMSPASKNCSLANRNPSPAASGASSTRSCATSTSPS